MTAKLTEAALKIKAKTGLPQSYVITKSTAPKSAIVRETLSNNAGKVYTIADLQKVLDCKWVHGFVYYASRVSLSPSAAEDFPIVAVKKGRKVIGYRYEPLVAMGEKVSTRASGKWRPVKPDAIIGKWEAKLRQRAAQAAAAAEQAEVAVAPEQVAA